MQIPNDISTIDERAIKPSQLQEHQFMSSACVAIRSRLLNRESIHERRRCTLRSRQIARGGLEVNSVGEGKQFGRGVVSSIGDDG
ncbi:hypothetical protein LZ554_002481 [Drepanopeziza brunnea f. sp. 'monogermtubi']|nr:hypothetical protein LZ554_002481 [Drepanopeziza brunnea f. sp. 'monogermtubi']